MQLQWPIKNINKHRVIRISQWFGPSNVSYRDYGMIGHNGIDIAAPKLTPIYAAHDGYVIEADTKPTGYGIRVTQYFEEDGIGWELHYGHMDHHQFPDITYNRNLRDRLIKAGEVIGYVDSTGNSSGHHLHFGVRQYKNGQLLNHNNGYLGGIDPRPYLPKEYPVEGEDDMITLDKVNGTVYLNFNNKFSIGIASEAFAKELTSADIPTVDKQTIPPEKFTLSSDSFVIHKK